MVINVILNNSFFIIKINLDNHFTYDEIDKKEIESNHNIPNYLQLFSVI